MVHTPIPRLISALALGLLAGCPFGPDPEEPEPPIRTDLVEYTARLVPRAGRLDRDEYHEFTVVAGYENRTGGTVYL
jgi:hypothetical protein